MHGVYGGVTKALISLWFDSSHHGQAWYCKRKMSIVEERLSKINPTFETTKAVRSLNDRKYWKASEYQFFLLFYSLPCMKDILPDDYFSNLKMLVSAVYALNKSSISKDDLNECELSLQQFHQNFIILYGERHASLNIHYLLHLVEMVRDLGPLWANTCYEFENANGTINKLFHGTKKIDMQIMESVAAIQFLHVKLSMVKRARDEVLYDFLKERPSNTSNQHISYIKGIGRVTTRNYTRCKRKADFAITYEDDNKTIKFGLIEDILNHKQLIVSELVPISRISHITKFQPLNYLTLRRTTINTEKITGKCIYMDLDNGLFLATVTKNLMSD